MKPGRNDPCPCGSGSKYKKCCGASPEQALESPPSSPSFESLIRLAQAQQAEGRPADAIACYLQALEIDPAHAETYINLANLLNALGHHEDATACGLRAIQLEPGSADAHNNLGNALKALGRLDEAEANYRRALEIAPAFAQAHCNLGACLKQQGRLDEAIDAYRQSLTLAPDLHIAHYNLGNLLHDTGRLAEAEASYRRALAIFPNLAEAWCNLGNVLRDAGRLAEASDCYLRALDVRPDLVIALDNLLFVRNYQSGLSPSMLLAEARQFGELAARLARPYTEWPNQPDPERRLRIGLVSGDFFAHPVGYFIEGVLSALRAHAPERLEFVGYSNHVEADATTAPIAACCAAWRPVAGLSDEALAGLIRDDAVDILIDLSGHTARNRLTMFAWRPAPVQLTWLGYFATTGVAAIDYLIADPWVLPESEERYFTEKIWRLPETRLCFTPPDAQVEVSPLPALANGYVTFGCFNNLSKLNDDVVALWSRILAALPDSRLFLKSNQLGVPELRQETLGRFAAQGIAPDRLILEGFESREQYLAAHHRVDLAFDPFPFPGGTTTMEALWMGVPVLTLQGERFLSRQGVGMLGNVGLADWIAKDADDYLRLALAHAVNLAALSEVRGRLRQQALASPMFDAPRFAGHFESALRAMWRQYCTKQN